MFSETFSIQPERMARRLAWALWGVATLLMLVSARQVEMALAMSTRTSGLTTWLTAGAIVAGLFWCQLATVYFVLQRSSIFYSVLYSVLTFLLSGFFNVWAFTAEATVFSGDWWVSSVVGLLVPFLAFLSNQVATQCYLLGAGFEKGAIAIPKGTVPSPEPEPRLADSALPDVFDDAMPTPGNAHSVSEQEQPVSSTAEIGTEVAEVSIPESVIEAEEEDSDPVNLIDTETDSETGAEVAIEDEVVDTDSSGETEVPVVEDEVDQTDRTDEEPEPEIVMPEGQPVAVDIKDRRVTVRVEKQAISNSRRKKLHEQLRRIASVAWDKAEKAESRKDGKVFWTLGGTITAPEIKGKKSKKKRQAAQSRHVEAVSDQLLALIGQYKKT